MHTVIDKSAIKEAYTSVTVLQRKEELVDQQKLVDAFLDSILAFRRVIDERSEVLESLDKQMITITRIDRSELAEEDYKDLNELVKVARKAYSISMRFYRAIREVRDQVASKEAARFKEAAANFKESTQDLEIAFLKPSETKKFASVEKRRAILLGFK